MGVVMAAVVMSKTVIFLSIKIHLCEHKII